MHRSWYQQDRQTYSLILSWTATVTSRTPLCSRQCFTLPVTLPVAPAAHSASTVACASVWVSQTAEPWKPDVSVIRFQLRSSEVVSVSGLDHWSITGQGPSFKRSLRKGSNRGREKKKWRKQKQRPNLPVCRNQETNPRLTMMFPATHSR